MSGGEYSTAYRRLDVGEQLRWKLKYSCSSCDSLVFSTHLWMDSHDVNRSRAMCTACIAIWYLNYMLERAL